MDTYGWDVVCACSGGKLNELLAIQFAKTPASLSYDDNAGTQIAAQFDAWRIVAGGSNKKLRVEMPAKAGSLDTPLASVKLDGVVIVAELELAFITNATVSASHLRLPSASTRSRTSR